MIKMTILLRRKPELSREDFITYHRNNHARLFASLPEAQQHVRRYVQCHSTGDQLPGLPDNHIDGSTELWFDDLAGLAALFQSPSYMQTIRPDEEKFLDIHACEFLVATEHEVMPAAHA